MDVKKGTIRTKIDTIDSYDHHSGSIIKEALMSQGYHLIIVSILDSEKRQIGERIIIYRDGEY